MLYDEYWSQEMPNLIEAIKRAVERGKSKMNVTKIKEHGRRADYMADFRIVKGKPEFKRTYGSTKEQGRAHERSLWNVLPKEVKDAIRECTISFNIPLVNRNDSKPLFLEIRSEGKGDLNSLSGFGPVAINTSVELRRTDHTVQLDDKLKPEEIRAFESKKKLIEPKAIHNKIQNLLISHLRKKYGINSVQMEVRTGMGTAVDIELSLSSGRTFFEIKSYQSVRLSIRDAIGQLLEYGFWPEQIKDLRELIIVSHIPIDEVTKDYLMILRKTFGMKLYYQSIDLKTGTLSEKS